MLRNIWLYDPYLHSNGKQKITSNIARNTIL